MYLTKTSTTGMAELSGCGYSNQADYDKTMSPANLKGVSVVVASLTSDQTTGAKLLLKNGFKQIGELKQNPNTGHMISLLVKFIRGE